MVIKINDTIIDREKGFLNINSYFSNILGRECDDLDELYELGLIDIETSGISNKFWITDPITKNHLVLFKQTHMNNDYYYELFSEEISKLMGMETAHYDLAKFNGELGVISYNYKDPLDKSYSGTQIISDFYQKKLEDDLLLSKLYDIDYYKDNQDEATYKLNNLESIWSILEERYQNNPLRQKIVYQIMDKLVDILIFDCLTSHSDRHSDNWSIVEKEDGNISLPQYDTNMIFGSNDYHDYTLELIASNKRSKVGFNAMQVLDDFLKISDQSYLERCSEKIKILENNYRLIPQMIEERIEYSIPLAVKEDFYDHCFNNIRNAKGVLKNYNKNK